MIAVSDGVDLAHRVIASSSMSRNRFLASIGPKVVGAAALMFFASTERSTEVLADGCSVMCGLTCCNWSNCYCSGGYAVGSCCITQDQTCPENPGANCWTTCYAGTIYTCCDFYFSCFGTANCACVGTDGYAC